MKRKPRSDAGVTLIEMLVVVTIIGLFAFFVLPRFMGVADRSKRTKAGAQIAAYMQALHMYQLDNGAYPTTEQGLLSLRVKPEGAPNWKKPYVEQDIENDPWGHPYVYRFPGEHDPDTPEIICYGADGAPGGEDLNADIVSWKAK